MPQFPRHFTVEEARALLPELRALLQDAQRRRQQVQEADAHLGQLVETTQGDVGGAPVAGLLWDWLQLNQQLERLQQLGIQLKDFDRGLVDFPHLRDGREVFLCWELGEDDIEFWHDLDTGYAGRERL